MDRLTTTLLERVHWDSLRSASVSGTGADVPNAVACLAAATTNEEAKSAFVMLDNNVIVQGHLFEAGPPLVPVLLALLTDDVSPIALSWTVDLLVELGCGESHLDEIQAGNEHLGEQSRQYLREGLHTLYGLLRHPDEFVRHSALILLGEVETNRDRLRDVARAFSASDPSNTVRKYAKAVADSLVSREADMRAEPGGAARSTDGV